MAETDFGSLDNLRKKVWSARTWKQGRDGNFFFAKGFVGSGTDDTTRPVHYVTDLTKTMGGDKCIMHLVPDLTSDGVTGDRTLKGKEEALTAADIEITIDQLRHAVKSRGKMSEQRTVVKFRAEAKDTLANWLSQKMEELAFLVASGVSLSKTLGGADRSSDSELPLLAYASAVTAPSSARKLFAGTSVTATNGLAASDKMSWNLIVKANALAKRKRMKPMRYNGREIYAMVMSTEQARDLKQDSDYLAAVKDAGVRGEANPLFRGHFAEVDGVVLFEHPKVYNTLEAASGSKWGATGTVDGAQSLFMGAQAIGFAKIGDPDWGEDADDDYGNQQNVSYGGQFGYKKPVFPSQYDSGNDEDFGIVSVYTAAAA